VASPKKSVLWQWSEWGDDRAGGGKTRSPGAHTTVRGSNTVPGAHNGQWQVSRLAVLCLGASGGTCLALLPRSFISLGAPPEQNDAILDKNEARNTISSISLGISSGTILLYTIESLYNTYLVILSINPKS